MRAMDSRRDATEHDFPRAWPELEEALPPAKARLARRKLLAGATPGEADFRARALALSKEQAQRLHHWLGERPASTVAARAPSADGSVRLVVALRDGETVETVAMPSGTVCVSTQAGCAVACRFCASGALGLKRNLDAIEIVEQVVHARRELAIDRVVYMGMGEPSHNLAAVLDAVAMLARDAQIGPTRQVVSTVGSGKAFAGLAAARAKPCLALSLHSTDDSVRRELLPHAGAEPVADLVAGAARYVALQGKPLLVEWTLLAGVNDREQDADALAALLAGVRCCVNFIRWNPVEGMPFAPTPLERAVALRERVKSRGLLATLRASTGRDVDAACGQLRRRSGISTSNALPVERSIRNGSTGR